MKILGIDENGYGPILGPLVITGVCIEYFKKTAEIENLEIWRFPSLRKIIKDSKEIFKKGNYAYLESISLSIIENYLSSLPQNIQELLKNLSLEKISVNYNLKIPLWTEKKLNLKMPETLKIIDIKVKIIDAYNFNKLLKRFGKKNWIDFYGFKEILKNIKWDIAILGKIGGKIFYKNFFDFFNFNAKIIEEKKEKSIYEIEGNKRLYFVLDAERFLPVAMASIIGKYIREIFMLLLSKELGFDTNIPVASGYRHDSRTYKLIEKIPEDKKIFYLREK